MSHTHHLVISWTTTRKHLLLCIYTCMHMCKYVCKYICKSEGWKLVSLISVELIKPEPHGLPYGWNRFLDNVFVEGNVLPGVKLSQTFQKEKKKKAAPIYCRLLRKLFFHCIISTLVASRVCSLCPEAAMSRQAPPPAFWPGPDEPPFPFCCSRKRWLPPWCCWIAHDL